MAKKLQHIADPVRRFLQVGAGQSVLSHGKKLKHAVIPDAIKLSMMRGEAILRFRVFEYFRQKSFDESFQYHAFNKLFHESNVLIDFVQRSGLLTFTEQYLKQAISEEWDSLHKQCYQYYCLLIDQLNIHSEKQLSNTVTVSLVQHYLPSFFPKAHQVEFDLAACKKDITRLLNRHFNVACRLKESFKAESDHVDFSVYAHATGYHPALLSQLEGKRLKPTRNKCYKVILRGLEDGDFPADLELK